MMHNLTINKSQEAILMINWLCTKTSKEKTNVTLLRPKPRCQDFPSLWECACACVGVHVWSRFTLMSFILLGLGVFSSNNKDKIPWLNNKAKGCLMKPRPPSVFVSCVPHFAGEHCGRLWPQYQHRSLLPHVGAQHRENHAGISGWGKQFLKPSCIGQFKPGLHLFNAAVCQQNLLSIGWFRGISRF